MKLLLDTHIILWAFTDDDRLSARARKEIVNEKNEKFYSIASIWEVSIVCQICLNILTHLTELCFPKP